MCRSYGWATVKRMRQRMRLVCGAPASPTLLLVSDVVHVAVPSLSFSLRLALTHTLPVCLLAVRRETSRAAFTSARLHAGRGSINLLLKVCDFCLSRLPHYNHLFGLSLCPATDVQNNMGSKLSLMKSSDFATAMISKLPTFITRAFSWYLAFSREQV